MARTLHMVGRSLRSLSGMTRSALVLAALAAAGWALYLAWPRRMRWVRSNLTGSQYYVKNMPDAEAVADRLAFLELRIRDFLHKAEGYAPGDPRLLNISRRWSGTLAETPHDEDVAYSVAKDTIHVCVRAPGGGLESENTGMFVLLHELAHIATDKYGHPPEFWSNMRFLLELAEATGSYKYENFDTSLVTYCGRKLAASPLSCVKNGACGSEIHRGRAARQKNSLG